MLLSLTSDQLEAVFWKRGAASELLTDYDSAFRSRRFQTFACQWGINVRFLCAHVPSGNGVIERCHRSVKLQGLDDATCEPDVTDVGMFCKDDKVWARSPDGRCDSQYGKGVVTQVVSPRCVEVDGVPRLARNWRWRAPSEGSCVLSTEDEEPIMIWPSNAEAHGDEAMGSSMMTMYGMLIFRHKVSLV